MSCLYMCTTLQLQLYSTASSRYAELYPDEVDRIFMLCPSFCLGTRAPKFVNEEEMVVWKREGARGTK